LLAATYATAGTDASTTCTFDDNDQFTIKGRIFDKNDGYTTYTATAHVADVAPTATFTVDPAINEGDSATVRFTNASSPSNADTAAGFHYAFACDGGSLDTATYAEGSGTAASTSCTFNDNGNFTVRGRIIDKDGGYTEYTATTNVADVAPTATLSNNGPIDEGGLVNVSFSGQSDPSSTDTGAGFRYSFDCTNNPGNLATTYAAAGTGASTSCTFNDNGTYTVLGRILDKDNVYRDYTTDITVNNVATTATFNAPSSVNEGSASALSLTSPSDPSTADTVSGFTYAFDCGSGFGSYSASNSTNCPTTDNGSRTVKGRIKDKDSGVNEYSAGVTVNNVAPAVTAAADQTATRAPASRLRSAASPTRALIVRGRLTWTGEMRRRISPSAGRCVDAYHLQRGGRRLAGQPEPHLRRQRELHRDAEGDRQGRRVRFQDVHGDGQQRRSDGDLQR
jgi:hypothetical protein